MAKKEKKDASAVLEGADEERELFRRPGRRHSRLQDVEYQCWVYRRAALQVWTDVTALSKKALCKHSGCHVPNTAISSAALMRLLLLDCRFVQIALLGALQGCAAATPATGGDERERCLLLAQVLRPRHAAAAGSMRTETMLPATILTGGAGNSYRFLAWNIVQG